MTISWLVFASLVGLALIVSFSATMGWLRLGGYGDFARRRPIECAAMSALFAICVAVGGTKPTPVPGGTFSFENGLHNFGSYATGNVVHVSWTYDPIILPVYRVYIDYRLKNTTNDWTRLAETSVGDLSWDGILVNAASNTYMVYSSYIPPEPVHTNGVWVYKTLKDRNERYALPLRARIEKNGVAIATPAEKRKDLLRAFKVAPYLYKMHFDDSYPEDAAWYYEQAQHEYGCSVRRVGNIVERNLDWKFDAAAEFVTFMCAAPGRFASVGVANVGTNLTDAFVQGGEWSRYYKALPGHTVDGINERGVFAEVNVTAGTWPRTTGEIHGLGAVRWVLDNATSAGMAASNLAAKVYLPQGFGSNFHWMICDADETWIVENGEAHRLDDAPAVMTNFNLYNRVGGEGYERWTNLVSGASITSQWWTLAYLPTTEPVRVSDIGTDTNAIFSAWASGDRESHRGQTSAGQSWWQTVHTSVYDIEKKELRIMCQEQPTVYSFTLED